MRALANLIVDLRSDTFDEAAAAAARGRLAARGFRIEERERDDALCAWIDIAFGGGWSGEAFRAKNLVVSHDGQRRAFVSLAAQGLRFAWLRNEGSRPGTGIFGPIGVSAEARGSGVGTDLALLGCLRMRELGYDRSIIPAVGEVQLERFYERALGARVVERIDPTRWWEPRARVVAMASGNGSNLQALLDAIARSELPIDLAAVIVNRNGAYAAERASAAGVRHIERVLWNRAEEARASYDARLTQIVEHYEPEGVVLLGWMHLLDDRFVRRFPELLNLHPAYLPHDPRADNVALPDGSTIPAFRGAHAIRDAVAARSPWIGASVHRVSAEADRGEVLVRRPLLSEGRNESALADALRPIEHRVTLEAIRLWCFMRDRVRVV
ncbi:MAG: formyltransferase family protein [Candidatus Baltobacteraceae bacterium]